MDFPLATEATPKTAKVNERNPNEKLGKKTEAKIKPKRNSFTGTRDVIATETSEDSSINTSESSSDSEENLNIET